VAHHWDVPNISRVVAFKLGGEHGLPPIPEDTRQMPEPAPVTASAEVIERGHEVYARHCSYCHGDGLRTGGVTPDLRWSSPQVHEIWQDIVRGGILEARGMVSFSDFVTEEDAEAIRQYVLAEANRLYRRHHPEQAARGD
jgi:mono/diheme cytochrome c family protein